VEASLVADRRFSAPGKGGDHCYHACRLVHRVRLMRAMESCCERWGSVVHQLWDGNSPWRPNRIAGRLQLREAGFAEDTAEREAVVAEIAAFLADRRGKDPFVRDRSLRGLPAERSIPTSVRLSVRRALRESTYTLSEAREAAQPSTFVRQPAAEEAVSRAMRNMATCLAPLPIFHEDRRLATRAPANSVRNEALET
jgi:hypothetical protein